jgi:hypothetical protein
MDFANILPHIICSYQQQQKSGLIIDYPKKRKLLVPVLFYWFGDTRVIYAASY